MNLPNRFIASALISAMMLSCTLCLLLQVGVNVWEQGAIEAQPFSVAAAIAFWFILTLSGVLFSYAFKWESRSDRVRRLRDE